MDVHNANPHMYAQGFALSSRTRARLRGAPVQPDIGPVGKRDPKRLQASLSLFPLAPAVAEQVVCPEKKSFPTSAD